MKLEVGKRYVDRFGCICTIIGKSSNDPSVFVAECANYPHNFRRCKEDGSCLTFDCNGYCENQNLIKEYTEPRTFKTVVSLYKYVPTGALHALITDQNAMKPYRDYELVGSAEVTLIEGKFVNN